MKKMIDISLSDKEEEMLRSCIGKRLQAYSHDEFQFTPSSTQAVQIMMDGNKSYYLYSFTKPCDYFGSQEDVAVWSLEDRPLPLIANKHFVTTPVEEVVKEIMLIQENQCVCFKDNQSYNVRLTRGIIIDFEDHQIAFEKDIWFSEEIIIHKGYDLLNRFTPTDRFGKDWEEGVRTECSRILIPLFCRTAVFM